jgi:hypothetical protein
MYVCTNVYNINGGVANIFYQSCAQIDYNQQVYEAHIWMRKYLETPIQKQDLAQTEEIHTDIKMICRGAVVCMLTRTLIKMKWFEHLTLVPNSLRNIQSVDSFKKDLKTHLFRQAYGDYLYLLGRRIRLKNTYMRNDKIKIINRNIK